VEKVQYLDIGGHIDNTIGVIEILFSLRLLEKKEENVGGIAGMAQLLDIFQLPIASRFSLRKFQIFLRFTRLFTVKCLKV
jgi:hypothetical protein